MSGAAQGPAAPRRRVLLVEDEPSLVTTLTDRLEAEGYAVESAGDGNTGLERALATAFDVIVLDVMLPGRDGFDVCRELRRRGSPTPVLMLTARTQVVDRVVGLKLGADDYLAKPFDMAELLARIESLLRRAQVPVGPSLGTFTFGEIEADFRRGEVKRGGRPAGLSSLELKLLAYFVEHRGEVLGRDELLEKVWGYDASTYSRTVDVHVSSLRQKLEENPRAPRLIVTVHGRGYRFNG